MKLSSLNFIESVAPISLRLFLKKQAKRIFGILIFMSCIFLITSLISWNPYDPSINNYNDNAVTNLLGASGAIISDFMLQFLGLGSFILITLLLLLSINLILQNQKVIGIPRYIRYPTFFILWILILSSIDITNSGLFRSTVDWIYLVGAGGLIGDLLNQSIQNNILSRIVVLSENHYKKFIFFISVILLASMFYLNKLIVKFKNKRQPKLIDSDYMHQRVAVKEERRLSNILKFFIKMFMDLFNAIKSLPFLQKNDDVSFEKIRDNFDSIKTNEHIIIGESFESDEKPMNFDLPSKSKIKPKRSRPKTPDIRKDNLDLFESNSSYELPSINLLKTNNQTDYNKKVSQSELEVKAEELKNVLLEYKVSGEIINIKPGPVVTLFEIEPSIGTRSSRVISLAEDIAMAMKAISARVAVIPGRNLIGIELPMEERSTVYLSEIIKSVEFENTNHKLAIALGKNIGGQPIVVDLSSMPHLLIAGTTGSGKSVGINTMILSLLYKYSPDDCKMIMIDPKMLELSVYEGIPHLLTPVVTEPKKAVVALKWIVKEMEKRYKNMSKIGVRNLDGYNKYIEREGGTVNIKRQIGYDEITGKPNYHNEEIILKKMPFIVVIVDEMADLMAVAGKEIEHSVARLAAMARAAGIHLIMATQRPSTDVITGTIKANFPTRISFQVSSKIDSRVILNESGAEQLLGKGDMLYMADGGRINRIHGAFVDDNEVSDIVNYLKKQAAPQYIEEIIRDPEESQTNSDGESHIEPQLFEQAVNVILSDQKASTSLLQRRLRIGYNKAADIIDKMEKDGIISEADHVGRREILLNEQNFDNI